MRLLLAPVLAGALTAISLLIGGAAPTQAELCPDLDRDRIIGQGDLDVVVAHWRAVRGDGIYRGFVDLNKDGEISLIDMALVALHWGEDCRG